MNTETLFQKIKRIVWSPMDPWLFYAMLNKCLALPLLESWAEYLWANGRERNLITLLDNGEGQGYTAWRVLPALAEWQNIVESGLHSQMIAF